MFRTIVVPIDLGGISSRTAALASKFAADQKATLHYVYVFNLAHHYALSAFAMIDQGTVSAFTMIDQGTVDFLERTIAERLAVAVAEAERLGVDADSHVVHGTPTWKLILEEAQALHADLIVMRTHGRKGFSRALNGSVTEDVVLHGDLPVLVLREP